jgi:hypothetical protein
VDIGAANGAQQEASECLTLIVGFLQVGTAVGFASRGFKPFCSTFAYAARRLPALVLTLYSKCSAFFSRAFDFVRMASLGGGAGAESPTIEWL